MRTRDDCGRSSGSRSGNRVGSSDEAVAVVNAVGEILILATALALRYDDGTEVDSGAGSRTRVVVHQHVTQKVRHREDRLRVVDAVRHTHHQYHRVGRRVAGTGLRHRYGVAAGAGIGKLEVACSEAEVTRNSGEGRRGAGGAGACYRVCRNRVSAGAGRAVGHRHCEGAVRHITRTDKRAGRAHRSGVHQELVVQRLEGAGACARRHVVRRSKAVAGLAHKPVERRAGRQVAHRSRDLLAGARSRHQGIGGGQVSAAADVAQRGRDQCLTTVRAVCSVDSHTYAAYDQHPAVVGGCVVGSPAQCGRVHPYRHSSQCPRGRTLCACALDSSQSEYHSQKTKEPGPVRCKTRSFHKITIC